MKALVWVLPFALCACTSQQYAELNQRVNDSIARTLGTRTEPPPSEEWKSEIVIDTAEPVPIPEARIPEPIPQVTFTPKPQPKQPTAGSFDLVNGAVICPSFDLADFMAGEINKARHARESLSPELRRQAALINGYDYGAEPRPSDYGCVLAPEGTPLNVEEGNYVPVVSGVLPDGRKFKGVTIPNMIDR